MTKPQTLESIIVHNSNPIFPTLSVPLQTIEFVGTEPNTPFRPNQSQTVNSNEFIAYSRKKKKSQEDIEQQILLGLVHESKPNSVLEEAHSGNIDSNPNESKDDELNLLIVKTKGVRSCTNHLIFYFISYKSLSPGYRAFVTSFTDIEIPNNI